MVTFCARKALEPRRGGVAFSGGKVERARPLNPSQEEDSLRVSSPSSSLLLTSSHHSSSSNSIPHFFLFLYIPVVYYNNNIVTVININTRYQGGGTLRYNTGGYGK